MRSEIFTRTFPRCGVHQPFGDWATYADFIDLLTQTGRIVESTQLWWSVRPHHVFGTVELRICDAQTRGPEATNLAAMITACIAQSALDYDDGRLGSRSEARAVEENLWQAIRHGLDGSQIDFARREAIPTLAAVEGLLEWTEPAREALGLDVELPDDNGAQRARAAFEGGQPLPDVYRAILAETAATYRAVGGGDQASPP